MDSDHEKFYERLNDLDVWRSGFVSKTAAEWRRQDELNTIAKDRLDNYSGRIRTVEKRLAVIVAMAVLIGSIVGAAVNYAVAMTIGS